MHGKANHMPEDDQKSRSGADQSADRAWSVRAGLPARRREVTTEWQSAVRESLADGMPRSRVERDRRTAQLVGRRLRFAAAKLGAQLQIRLTPDPAGVRITFVATYREDSK